jgi:anti-sigma-K factor RskA
VLGALPPEESAEFENAMNGDLQLQLLVEELRGTAGALALAVPRVTPPPALKQRILQAIDERARLGGAAVSESADISWMFWVPWTLAACFAILCVVLISLGHNLRQQAVRLQQDLAEREQEAGQLREQVAELNNNVSLATTNYQTRIAEIQRQVVQRMDAISRQNAVLTNQLSQQNAETRRQLGLVQDQADGLKREKRVLEEALAGVSNGDKDQLSTVRLAVLRPTTAGPAGAVGASIWSAQEQRGQLVLDNLPPLGPNQTYQFWLIDPKLAIPISGGVLSIENSGSVRVQFRPEIRVDGAERFAISIEPRGGSRTPSSRIVMASQ